MTEYFPQLTFLALLILEVGFSIAYHGRPKEGKHSLWNTLFSFVVIVAILNWGGFFDGLLGL